MILVRVATARFLAELAVAARLGVDDPGRGWATRPTRSPEVWCARADEARTHTPVGGGSNT